MECKKCSKCQKIKDLSLFYIDKKSLKPIAQCKECYKTERTKYARTKRGLVTRIYGHQRFSCRARGYSYPKYTLEELLEYCNNNAQFSKLYDKWVDTNYNKHYTPSIDRLNDYETYSFDNMQVLTYIENVRKGNLDAKLGINNKMNKSVIKYDLKGTKIEEFFSLKEAERCTGIHNGNISNCCLGRYKTAGGYIWKYRD